MSPSPSSAADAAQHTRTAHGHAPDRSPLREPFPRLLPWLLLVGGLLGAGAAFVLTVEKIALITDPEFIPSCSLNPVLNCGSIMKTDQAELLGFPNPLIGLATFPVLAATGALLLARVRLPRWYWLGLQAGATLAVVFVGWLIFQSLYRIGALCPYCMVVWAIVIPVFWYLTLSNLATGRLGVAGTGTPIRMLVTNHAVALTLITTVIAALVTHRFWDYWSSLIT
ncbi:vitamin K epoxide reductase family protein [Nocardioides aurantiacus]|uniref:Putative membrane protein n=1 Tax=Nocardioides aurantiacus TaxID=86796 RepID=A0A3N2CWE2_9ACTN|nr:vitamin K epoxide reductase family protein [Nocardioides aurantiacus]ROR91809.1 putative membrane protein [Nocardioides aurantiacus]